MDLEIMYGDLTMVRVPHARAGSLVKTGVLFMILSAETTERMSRRVIDGKHYRRVSEESGMDHYAYETYAGEGDPSVLIHGWDDRSYDWVSTVDPFGTQERTPRPGEPELPHPDDKINFPPWIQASAIVFSGVQLERAEWDRALAKFSAEMH